MTHETDLGVSKIVGIPAPEVASFKDKYRGSMMQKIMHAEMSLMIESFRTQLETCEDSEIQEVRGSIKALRRLVSYI